MEGDLKNIIYNTSEEKEFLEDMMQFYSSYLDSIFHLKSFLVACKYRDILYERYSVTLKLIHVVAKLFG